MSHDVSIVRGRAEMAYAGTPPWHGLGQAVARGASSAEMLRAASLDWSVSKQPMTVAAPNSRALPITRASLIVRDDWWAAGDSDAAVLGIASPEYVPVQNRQIFGILDPLVPSMGAGFETAGALRNGQRVWVLVRLGYRARVARSDVVDMYLLVSNCHDGWTGMQAKLTPVRVVCANTLAMALTIGRSLFIPHDQMAARKLEVACDVLLGVHQHCRHLETMFQEMARRQLSEEELAAFLECAYPDPLEPNHSQGHVDAMRKRRLATMLFEDGTGNRLEGVAGSVWAALNAVTELVDHERRDPAERLESIWWGEGSRTKLRAMAAATALITKGKRQSIRDSVEREHEVPSLA